MKNILISGLQEEDAGKTHLACAILSILREKGINAGGFKPKAGNSIWYDFDLLQDTLKNNRLYGKDAILLKKYSDTDLDEEILSPVHRLWSKNPTFFTQNKIPKFIVDRITLDDRNLIVINDTISLDSEIESLIDNLKHKKVNSVEIISTLKEHNTIVHKYYDDAILTNQKKMKDEFDVIVYESYCDIALPYEGIKDLDLVFVVEPGYIYVYDGEKYILSVDMTHHKESSTNRAIELMKPTNKIRVPPFRSNDIIDGLKDNSLLKKVLDDHTFFK